MHTKPSAFLLLPGIDTRLLPAEFLYRYKEGRVGGYLRLTRQVFRVIRQTPQGYCIAVPGNKTKWVSGFSRKRFAYPLKAQALHSYYLRKNRQVEILEYQLSIAKKARFVTMRERVALDLTFDEY